MANVMSLFPANRGASPAPFNVSRWFAIVGFLSITAVSATCAMLLSHFLTERMLRQEGVLTMEFVQSLVGVENSLLRYFTGEETRDAAELKAALQHIAALPDTLRANIYNRDHVLFWSTDNSLVGKRFGANPELDEALSGQLVIHGDSDAEGLSKEEHQNLGGNSAYFVEIYVPVRDTPHGQVIGVVELYKSPKALAEALQSGRIYSIVGAAAAGLFLYVALFGLSRRADTVIRTQRDRLVESEILATVGEMGSAVAHGIRNPLASIRSSAELSLDGTPDLARESANDIIAEVDRLEEWVRNLLSYSRPLSGTPEAVALPKIVHAAIEHFARELEKRNIAGDCKVSGDLPLAKANPLLLGQVVHSLLANAVEAIQHDGRIEIQGEAMPDQRRVAITIRDSGPGMTPEQLKRVFTPFYTTKPAGLGVGLALAKRIIERFDGRIAIDSTPGCGTTVRLSMPSA
jgi:signal transduction histidine kinase